MGNKCTVMMGVDSEIKGKNGATEAHCGTFENYRIFLERQVDIKSVS